MNATGLIALGMALAIGLSAIGSGIGQGMIRRWSYEY